MKKREIGEFFAHYSDVYRQDGNGQTHIVRCCWMGDAKHAARELNDVRKIDTEQERKA